MSTPNAAPSAATNSPENAQPIPQLPGERQPHDIAERDRVFALYYRTWMNEPELIQGIVTDVVVSGRPDVNGSLGYVNIATPQTPDNRTGSFIGIDINSTALIPESVLSHFKDGDFLTAWLADGSVAWEGEREMLETVLRKQEYGDTYDGHHPSRAREHTKMIPGSAQGKVAHLTPPDLSSDNN